MACSSEYGVEFTSQNLSLDLKVPRKLTFFGSQERHQSEHPSCVGQDHNRCFLARGIENKLRKNDSNRRDGDRRDEDRPRVTSPCGTCKLMGVSEDKAMHLEKNCWNEKRFPDLVKQLKAKNPSSVKIDQTFADLAIGDSICIDSNIEHLHILLTSTYSVWF